MRSDSDKLGQVLDLGQCESGDDMMFHRYQTIFKTQVPNQNPITTLATDQKCPLGVVHNLRFQEEVGR